MIVSWNWLKEYVLLDMSLEELEQRLMMAGLNHEGTEEVDGDFAVDLEVTSNRPDCLGHLGVAREVAALWQRKVKYPAAQPTEGKTPLTELADVQIEVPALCPRYIARVIRGCKVGPSPHWLVRRLKSLGQPSINNVVDITNYVLFECGQPLHAFDYAKLNKAGGKVKIIVRQAKPGEKLEAINHKTYELAPGVCVIADAEIPVAMAGIMGGASTEVSEKTVDVLIEAAEFDPVAVRHAARKYELHSPSSYRFERRIDPQGVDWASRRCCELILELAGGELAAGAIDAGGPPPQREPIPLRFDQLQRILGIEIPTERAKEILAALGNQEVKATKKSVEVIPPSWRRDLMREVDLIEEVGRIYGYEHIPEDVVVPLAPSARLRRERVLHKIRHTLTALGYDEAMTISAVSAEWSESFSPWTKNAALEASTSVIGTAKYLRRSLVPSLLGTCRTNEKVSNEPAELFEIAKVYLPRQGKLPEEPALLSLCSGGDFFSIKGALEALLSELKIQTEPEYRPTEKHELLDPHKACEVWLGKQRLGMLGEVSPAGLKAFELQKQVSVAEFWLDPLVEAAVLEPQFTPLPTFPASNRDLNIVVEEAIRWADLAKLVRREGGELLEGLEFREVYRNEKQLGPGKKSLLLTATFRSPESTLTTEQVDSVCKRVVDAIGSELGGQLRA